MFACLHAPGNLPLLVECATHFSPLIEETSSDAVVFDVRGLSWIIGEAADIAAAIQRRVGVAANIAIAANPDAAFCAAHGIRGVTVLPPGGEAAVLAPLPVYLLGGSPEFARNVDLWGIRTFGEFAALPPLGVAARLGTEGTHRQQVARGVGHRQLRVNVDALVFREERELEDAVDLLESLLFLLSQMLGELCERLRFHGRATNEIRLKLKLERAPIDVLGGYALTVALPVPMIDMKVLLKLLQLELNEKPPPAPVVEIELELMPSEARTTQQSLFVPASPHPERLEITLARIRGLVGEANVGVPRVLNTHRPDSFQMQRFEAVKEAGANEAAPSAYPKLALRRYRPPCPAQVWCSGQGRPIRILSSLGGGNIAAAAGPWQASGDWWMNEPWNRQEWDVDIHNLGVVRIFQDLLRRRWFIDGHYD